MSYSPQHIVAPDGTELVIITRGEYDRLTASRNDIDAADIVDADDAAAEMALGGGGMPAAVLDMVIDGVPPLVAWRRHRGLSQAELARRIGLAQTAISRLERAGIGAGRPATRRALAQALDAPAWALAPHG